MIRSELKQSETLMDRLVSRYRLREDKKELINFYDRDSTPLTNRYRWGRNLTMSQLARATGERLRPLM